jgi:phosphoribosylformylglycinamidine (FGAM) synthase-like enzyme
VQPPGGDAALVRVHGTEKALAMTTDCTPRYCYADPVEGGKQAVAEAYRNLCAVGARPLAITNCLNFGNPERPEIMGQLVGCVHGIAQACRALDFPVVSGNVSLYNETKGEDGSSVAILPTPAIGGVGLLEDWEKSATLAFKSEGETLMLIGHAAGHVGRSRWLEICQGRCECAPPPVDLGVERRLGELTRKLIAEDIVTAAHDISDGGALVAIAEMALAGNVGVEITFPNVANPATLVYGEDQGRMLVTTREWEKVVAAATAANLFSAPIGKTGGHALSGPGFTVMLADLRAAHEAFFPRLMGSELTPEF